MKKFIILTIVLFAIFSISGCSDTKASKETENESEHKEDESKTEVSLTEEQIEIMNIEFSKYEIQNISGYIKVTGEVAINPDQESKVGTLIPGKIVKIYAGIGSYVKAGQTLAVIENPEIIDVQVNYLSAKNDYDYAKREYERQLKLNNENIGSKKILSELESNYKKSLSNYKTLEEKLSSYKISTTRFNRLYTDSVANLQRYFNITAPISGSIVERNLTVGQIVVPSGDLFHIVNISTVFAELDVFEQDLKYISIGQRVKLEVSVNPSEQYEGEIVFINKIFDDTKRTVKVKVLINNIREKLLPNMFINAKIFVYESGVLGVPLSAIESEGDTKYIFAKSESESTHDEHNDHSDNIEGSEEKNLKISSGVKKITFKKVIINTGISDDKYVQIFPVDEMHSGDQVVSKGTFYLKSELAKGDLEGHEH